MSGKCPPDLSFELWRERYESHHRWTWLTAQSFRRRNESTIAIGTGRAEGLGKAILSYPTLPHPTPPCPYPSPPIPSHPILSYPKPDFSPYLLQSSTRHTPTYSTNTSRTHISLDMPSEMPMVGTDVSVLSHPSSLKGHLSSSLHLLHKATLLQLRALHHFSPTKEELR